MAVNNTPLVDEYSEFFPDNKTQPPVKTSDISTQMDEIISKPKTTPEVSDTIEGSEGQDVLQGGETNDPLDVFLRADLADPFEAHKKLHYDSVDPEAEFTVMEIEDIEGSPKGILSELIQETQGKPQASVNTNLSAYAHLRKPSALNDISDWIDQTFNNEDPLAIREQNLIKQYNELVGVNTPKLDPEGNFLEQIRPNTLFVENFKKNNPLVPENEIYKKADEAFRKMMIEMLQINRSKVNLADMKENLKTMGKLVVSAGYGILEGGAMTLKLPLYAIKYLPAGQILLRSENQIGGHTMSHMEAYHKLGQHYAKSLHKFKNGKYSMYAPFPFISEEEYRILNGPNAFAELWTKLFIDSNYKMRAGEDVSIITESVYPSILADSAIKGIDSVVDPMLQYLQIPDSEKTALTQGLSMGAGVFMPGNIFRIAAVGAKAATVGGKLALTKVGMPTLKMTNKVMDRVFNKGFLTNMDWLEKDMKLGAKVYADPDEIGFYTKIKNDTKRNFNMAVGAGSAYGVGHWLFEDSEYEPLSILMSLMGGMFGGRKLYKISGAEKSVKFLNRSFGLLHYWGDRLTIGLGRKLIGASEKGGNINAYLRFKGYTNAQIKAVEKKGREQLEELKRMYPEDEAYEKARALNIVNADNSYNTDFGKFELSFTSPAEIKFYNKIAMDLQNLGKTDPEFYKDIVASAKQADRLISRLSASFVGEAGENYERIVGSISQIIHITHFRNLQNALVNKLQLGLLGNFPKSKLLSDATRMERDIDKQIKALEQQIKGMKLKGDATEDVVEVTNKINAFLKYHLNHSVELTKKGGIFDRAKRGFKGVFMKKAEDELARQSKHLAVNDYGVGGLNKKNAANTLRRQNEGLFFGDSTGVFTVARKRNKELYTQTFDTADSQKLFLDGNPLMNPLMNDQHMSFMGEIEVLKSVKQIREKGKDITESKPLLESMRRRGFNNTREIQYKNNLNGYKTYIENLYREVFSPEELQKRIKQFGDEGLSKNEIVKRYENLLIKNKDSVINTDIPAHLSVREWHMLRSEMGKKQTAAVRAGNFTEANKYHRLHEKIDNLLDPNNPNNAKVVKLLEEATKDFKENILPFRQFMMTKIFSRDATGELTTDRLQYMALFFTQANNLHENAKQFKKFFYNTATKTYDPRAVQLLVKGLGVAIEGGSGNSINSNILAIQREFQHILPKETLEALGNLQKVREFKALGKAELDEDQIEALKAIENTMDAVADVRLKQLLSTVFAKKASNLGLQEVSETSMKKLDDLNYRGTDTSYSRAALMDAFFNVRVHTADKPIGITKEARKDWDTKEPGLVELQKIKDKKSVLLNKKDVDGPHVKSVAQIDKYAQNIKNLINKALPNQINVDDAVHPFLLLKQHLEKTFSPEENRKFMNAIQNMFLDELLIRSVKFTNVIKTTGSAARAKAARKNPDQFATQDNHTLALKQEVDATELHNFIQDNEEIFKIMYGVTEQKVRELEKTAISLLKKNKIKVSESDPVGNIIKAEKFGNKHFKGRVQDIRHAENITLLNQHAKILQYTKGLKETVQGIPTDYSGQMLLGRIYNSLKGVVSPRYVVAEGGIVKARLMRVNLLRSMLFDPAATQVIVDVFVKGINTSQNIKKLNSIVASAVGLDLSRNEESQLKTLANIAAHEIKTLTQADYASQTRIARKFAPTRFELQSPLEYTGFGTGIGSAPSYFGNEQYTGFEGFTSAINPFSNEPRLIPVDFPFTLRDPIKRFEGVLTRPKNPLLEELQENLKLEFK